MLESSTLLTLYERLLRAYGPQSWWPAETPFEVMIGAILTQNTAWTNVEKAITNLRGAGLLEPNRLHAFPLEELAGLIRPSGYFNVKARRLQHLCDWLLQQGGIPVLASRETGQLRRELLSVHGIGPETADDILLYAFERPVFVIDTYTRRLLSAHGLIRGDEDYEVLRGWFEGALDPDPTLYNEYHALIVRHAKQRCEGNEGCGHCRVESPLATHRG